MRSVLVVVAEEFSEQRPQVLLIQHDDVVETFSAKCPDDTFRNRVRTGRMNGCGDGIDPDPSGPLTKVAAVRRVTITEQVPRLVTPGRRLDELTPYPGGGRVGRHVNMHQLAPIMGDGDQHVERVEGQRGHR